MSEPVFVPPFVQNIPKQSSSRERRFPTVNQCWPDLLITGHMHASTLQLWGYTASCCHPALLLGAKAALPIHKATDAAGSQTPYPGQVRWLQVWQPEFNFWDPHGRRWELLKLVLWPSCERWSPYMPPINTCNKKKPTLFTSKYGSRRML